MAFDRLRLKLNDQDLGDLNLPITDLRLFDAEGEFINDAVRDLSHRIKEEEPVLLSVGLTRPWAPQDQERAHWLQVNNIYPVSDPLWG